MLRASAAAEAAGIPSSSLVCEGFLGQGATTSVGLGLPNLPMAKVPGHVDTQTDNELRQNLISVTVREVIENLTAVPPAAVMVPEPGPRDVILEGSFEEINRFFYENDWSDGLPIVPPTRSKIEGFLDFTDLPAGHAIGKLPPDNRQATVWNVAVNGVMAGCRPQYMPVLIALAEAMADPVYGVEHSGNTPGAETLITINGPIIKDLDFNYEQGVLRDGFQANTAIGRWWRLYLRNVAGFLPHQTDKGTFGNTWRVVLAENEDVLARIGWPPLSADFGHNRGENAVVISRYTGGDVITSVFGKKPEEMLPYLADALISQTGWQLIFTVGMADGGYSPLLILSPILAETIAKAGWSKDDVRQWLFENARISAAKFEQYIGEFTNLLSGGRSLYELARLGKANKVFGESDDPGRLVPIVCEARDIQIAVSGDPGRTNAQVFSHNGILGYPTSRAIRLPGDWRNKLAAVE
ncbi:MAG: hypothetical protein CFH40_01980 [Alphaproteobacteria bacterium MarineAlpha10_Bin3]|nr:MAG: hypothetical protein CFH40_01980 [Alphaproteobacteria bacterium MarineAlpha10_Bin3]PPR68620.1 MAG: hypothetical protein CFH09_01980 [Alphaproteobacteria bacterium MarineAlpha4_Bin1]